MIGNIDTENKNPIMSKSTTLYRILSLLLIINFYKAKWGRKKWKGLDLRIIQVYMWGLSGRANAERLAKMGRDGYFSVIPFTSDVSVMQLLSYCHINGFLRMEKASGDGVYNLSPKAYVLLNSLSDDDLRKEIDEVLKGIGIITKTKIKQLRIDWKDVTY